MVDRLAASLGFACPVSGSCCRLILPAYGKKGVWNDVSSVDPHVRPIEYEGAAHVHPRRTAPALYTSVSVHACVHVCEPVQISMLEVYMERVRDLLDAVPATLDGSDSLVGRLSARRPSTGSASANIAAEDFSSDLQIREVRTCSHPHNLTHMPTYYPPMWPYFDSLVSIPPLSMTHIFSMSSHTTSTLPNTPHNLRRHIGV